MITISKSKLKAQMLKIFREIEESGEEIIVTDNNRPGIRIQPINKKVSVEDAFGAWQGQVIFYEDPNAPTSDEWEEV